MYKTESLLNQLPEKIRSEFNNEVDRQNSNLDAEYECISDMVNYGLNWITTQKGDNWWSAVYYRLREIERRNKII